MSTPSPESEPVDRGPPIPTQLCLSLAARNLLLLLLVGVAIRGYVYLRNDGWENTKRFKQAITHLPPLVASADLPVIAVGASQIEQNFWPVDFDRGFATAAGRASTSANVGFVPVEIDELAALARWVGRLVEGRDNAIILLAPAPGFATKKKGPTYEGDQEIKIALLMGPGDFLRELLESPERAFRLLVYRAIDARPLSIKADLRALLFSKPTWWPAAGPPPKKPSPWLGALFQAGGSLRKHRDWDPAERGKMAKWFLPPEVQEAIKRTRVAEDHKELEGMVKGLGLRDTAWAPEEIDKVIAVVRELESTASVVIYMPPLEMATINESPTTRASRLAAIERIKRETGVCVLDMYDSKMFAASDFLDLMHLAPELSPKLSFFAGTRIGAWDRAGRRNCDAFEGADSATGDVHP